MSTRTAPQSALRRELLEGGGHRLVEVWSIVDGMASVSDFAVFPPPPDKRRLVPVDRLVEWKPQPWGGR
ncbi:hypothetical protein [Kitasatospora sp. NPDC002040]|uniref:hypothetical protein n=1 Tax=Kitasatospora sp. NPDC002040 TaxID=3154661 RepID=UPI003329C5A7